MRLTPAYNIPLSVPKVFDSVSPFETSNAFDWGKIGIVYFVTGRTWSGGMKWC